MSNIILCGFMGCGKSTVGKALANRLNMNWIDTDEYIVNLENRTIKEIIETYGEKYFRNLESSVLKKIRNCTNTVISLGGGTVLRSENVDMLKCMGTIVNLHVDESDILERLKFDESRPLFGKVSYAERTEVYQNVADFTINAGGNVNDVCDEILKSVPLEVGVNVKDNYDVIIGYNVLEHIGKILLDKVLCEGRMALIGDARVFSIYAQKIVKSLTLNGYDVCTFAFDSGEKSKTLSTVEKIYDFLSKNDIAHGSVILSLGGGVSSDIVGFAASTYMRGIRCVHIPTSLLAQVDASIGGKTGVNLSFGKNLVGTFYQPSLVVEDMNTLKSLPCRDFNSGMAEIIKCACIQDRDLFDMLSEDYKKHLKEIIFRTVSIKRDIIVKDEKESSVRVLLNFGHTIGHALEILSHFKLSHGEAVAIGMCMMTKASEKMGITKPQTYEKILTLCEKFSLPTNIKVSQKDIMNAIKYDKKRFGNSLICVLLEDISKPIIKKISLEEVEELVYRGLA